MDKQNVVCIYKVILFSLKSEIITFYDKGVELELNMVNEADAEKQIPYVFSQ